MTLLLIWFAALSLSTFVVGQKPYDRDINKKVIEFSEATYGSGPRYWSQENATISSKDAFSKNHLIVELIIKMTDVKPPTRHRPNVIEIAYILGYSFRDKRLPKWDAKKKGSKKSTPIPWNMVWSPEILIGNTVSVDKTLDKMPYLLSLTHDGIIIRKKYFRQEFTCSYVTGDYKKFPYRLKCDFSFTGKDWNNNKIRIYPVSIKSNLKNITVHGLFREFHPKFPMKMVESGSKTDFEARAGKGNASAYAMFDVEGPREC